MLSESLTIGLLLTLVFGALFFYVYSRVTYSEKRIGLMEKLLLNLKMEQEEKPIHILPRISPQMTFHQLSENTSSQISEPFVSSEPSVLPPRPSFTEPSVLPPRPSFTEPFVSSDNSEEDMYKNVLEEAHEIEDNSLPKIEINYEAMTKDELIEAAKTKGIRVGNRPGREKLLQLLKKSEDMKTSTLEGNALSAVAEVEI